MRDPSNSAPAEEAFWTAIDVARQQSARSLGLQAALALAKLLRSTGRSAEAHAVLAPALEGFSATPEMPEIAEAQDLLAALAETSEVGAAIARRDRRLRLQTSYGMAMAWSRGYAVAETRSAFDRVQELASRAADAPERYAAYYGQWVGSYTRGALRLAHETTEAFLREAEAEGRPMEAGVARRALGVTCLHLGEFAEARSQLERTIADHDPERDREARFRFGVDTELAAMTYLAAAIWPLGEVERAGRLIDQAVRRATEMDHVPTLVNVYAYKLIINPCGATPPPPPARRRL